MNCFRRLFLSLLVTTNDSSVIVKAKMRSSSWWKEFFGETNLEENVAAVKKFEQAASKMSYHPTCQIFHIKSYN